MKTIFNVAYLYHAQYASKPGVLSDITHNHNISRTPKISPKTNNKMFLILHVAITMVMTI